MHSRPPPPSPMAIVQPAPFQRQPLQPTATLKSEGNDERSFYFTAGGNAHSVKCLFVCCDLFEPRYGGGRELLSEPRVVRSRLSNAPSPEFARHKSQDVYCVLHHVVGAYRSAFLWVAPNTSFTASVSRTGRSQVSERRNVTCTVHDTFSSAEHFFFLFVFFPHTHTTLPSLLHNHTRTTACHSYALPSLVPSLVPSLCRRSGRPQLSPQPRSCHTKTASSRSTQMRHRAIYAKKTTHVCSERQLTTSVPHISLFTSSFYFIFFGTAEPALHRVSPTGNERKEGKGR